MLKESFDPRAFEGLFAAEDHHFWFRCRNRVISAAAQTVLRNRDNPRVLEIGCGNGTVLNTLEHACPDGQVIGMDLFYDGLEYAKQRCACPLIQADAAQPPFRIKFDLIGMFDVIEHLEQDVQVLKNAKNLLTPDGAIIVTVPAHMWLWSYADENACHVRRYSKATLTKAFNDAGLTVEFLTPFMLPLLPLMWLKRKITAIGGRGRTPSEMFKDDLKVSPMVNSIMTWLLSAEVGRIAKRSPISGGTSLLAISYATPSKLEN